MPHELAPPTTAPTRAMVLLFTDIVGSVALKTRLGTGLYAQHLARHDALFREIVSSHPEAEIRKDMGDGFLANFASPADAIDAALCFQLALATEPWAGEALKVRVGLHLGEVTEMAERDEGLAKLVGFGADLAARVMGLALPGQILMTRPAFDAAREVVGAHPRPADGSAAPELRWVAHGPYLFQGADETIDVFEVGANGLAPLHAPPDSAKARRAVPVGEEELYGWRPAVGLPVPGRVEWILERPLGEGGFGEVWLARHAEREDALVFKFCFDAEKLRSLRRELAIFRLVKEALGDREDIARIVDIQVDRPPFFLESEFTEQGDLTDWAEARGGIAAVPLETRLSLVAEVAEAVSAAHSVGILHKDIKPSNVLIYEAEDGLPHPRLADFGIGALTDTSRLLKHDITVVGFTETMSSGGSATLSGTRLYAPPESLAGRAFTVQGDVYALGIVLYQMVIGDLRRPLAHGWEREVADPLLREDIAQAVAGRPEDRFATAAALAERIRSLDARRDAARAAEKRAEQTRRRARLVRVAGVGTAALVVLLGLVGWMLVQETRSRREADRLRQVAEEERGHAITARQTAEAVSAFLNDDLLGAVDPRTSKGRDVTVREVLDTAEKSIQGRFDDRPEVEAALRQTLGRVSLGIGRYAEAEAHLERARALRTTLHGAESLAVAETLEAMATLASVGRGEHARGLELAQRVAAIRRTTLGADDALTMRAEADVGMYGALPEGKLSAGIDNPLMLNMLAKVRGKGETPEEMRAELIRMIYDVERMWTHKQREALLAYGEAVARPFFADPVFAERVPWAWSAMALSLLRDDRPVAAEGLAVCAVELGAKRFGEGHPNVVHAMSILATILWEQDRDAEAEVYFRKVSKLREQTLGEGHKLAVASRREHAMALVQLKRFAEAEPEALAVHRLRTAGLAPDAELVAEAVDLLVALYERWGKSEEAARWRTQRGG